MTGIIGVDCSGSKTYFPLYVGACYSKDRKLIEEVYGNVKKLAIKENKIFSYGREIKAVDLKSDSTMRQIIAEISKLKFNILVVENNDFQNLKKLFSAGFKWELKLDAIFWFLALQKLLKYEPKQVFLDVHYTKPSDRKLFEFLLTKLSENKKTPEFLTVSSKSESAVKLADLAAGIFRKNADVKKIYNNCIGQLDSGRVAQIMNQIRRI